MTEPSERAQELASRHEGLNQLALMERQAWWSNDPLDKIHHRFLKGLGTDFFRWLAEHHERTMT